MPPTKIKIITEHNTPATIATVVVSITTSGVDAGADALGWVIPTGFVPARGVPGGEAESDGSKASNYELVSCLPSVYSYE